VAKVKIARKEIINKIFIITNLRKDKIKFLKFLLTKLLYYLVNVFHILKLNSLQAHQYELEIK
jgi:hypothetical protein